MFEQALILRAGLPRNVDIGLLAETLLFYGSIHLLLDNRSLVALGRFARWMYRGGRPNRLVQIMNRISALVFARGVARDYLVTLEVTGRLSGRRISLPLVMVVVDGRRYLVSMLGEKAAWARNIRAGAAE